ncbi:MAG: hypothetical protein KAV87_43010, partial [Desulfobacteraceae bacterium]|nr:hypothetical protein [Desulfobacteraceae bacterium]
PKHFFSPREPGRGNNPEFIIHTWGIEEPGIVKVRLRGDQVNLIRFLVEIADIATGAPFESREKPVGHDRFMDQLVWRIREGPVMITGIQAYLVAERCQRACGQVEGKIDSPSKPHP